MLISRRVDIILKFLVFSVIFILMVSNCHIHVNFCETNTFSDSITPITSESQNIIGECHLNSLKSKRIGFTFHSDIVGDNFSIYLVQPPGYDANSSHKYPVVFILDGDWYLNDLERSVSNLTAAGSMPQAILVGIGYPAGNHRVRDYIYPHTPALPNSGGGDKFYGFLKDELIPYLDSNYNTDPLDRTLIGHSAGGYFTMYAFLQFGLSTEVIFTNFIDISGGGKFLTNLLPAEENLYNRFSDDVLRAKLFITIGGAEPIEFTDPLTKMARLITNRQYKGFKFLYKEYIGADHLAVFDLSLVDSLKWVFESGDMPIFIDETDDWKEYIVSPSGNGTKTNPYVIKDFFIDLQYYFSSGMEIQNSSKYFSIQNCTIINNNFAQNAGIRLTNCTNICISNCNISDSDSKNGITLYDSHNITLSGNSMAKSGLFVHNSLNNDIDSTNLVNNKPLFYYENQNKLIIDGLTDVGQLVLVNCHDASISNLDIFFASVGVLLSHCTNNSLSNIVTLSNDYGIYLETTDNSFFSNINASDNTIDGIKLVKSDNNRICNSTILSNGQYGIYLAGSFNNEIYRNTIISNEKANIYGNTGDNNIYDNIQNTIMTSQLSSFHFNLFLIITFIITVRVILIRKSRRSS
ncbi:MAG: right-handed parallel beta-helix repeat-containing protein [Candidatus Hodarchaeota archaeon]